MSRIDRESNINPAAHLQLYSLVRGAINRQRLLEKKTSKVASGRFSARHETKEISSSRSYTREENPT